MASSSSPAKPAAPATLPVWQQIPMSALAGVCAWVPTHPWELCKNRVILSQNGLTTAAAFRDMFGNGSAYNGFSAGISRQVVYTAFRLGLYEPIRGISTSLRGADPAEVSAVDRVVAGATAGVIASFLSSPVEVALVMQTSRPVDQPKLSLPGAFKEVMAAKGVAGFWSGCLPLMTRAAVVGVAQVSFNDQCKTWLKAHAGADTWEPRNLTATSGVITGIFYAFVTMPIEVARVRISAAKQKTTIAGAISGIVKEHGVRGVYSSYVPYAGRCVVHTATSFMILDEMKRRMAAR